MAFHIWIWLDSIWIVLLGFVNLFEVLVWCIDCHKIHLIVRQERVYHIFIIDALATFVFQWTIVCISQHQPPSWLPVVLTKPIGVYHLVTIGLLGPDNKCHRLPLLTRGTLYHYQTFLLLMRHYHWPIRDWNNCWCINNVLVWFSMKQLIPGIQWR